MLKSNKLISLLLIPPLLLPTILVNVRQARAEGSETTVIREAEVPIDATSDTPGYSFTFDSKTKVVNAFVKDIQNGASANVKWDDAGKITVNFSGGNPVPVTKTDSVEAKGSDLLKSSGEITVSVPAGRTVTGAVPQSLIKESQVSLAGFKENRIVVNVNKAHYIPHHWYQNGITKNNPSITSLGNGYYKYTFPYTQTYYVYDTRWPNPNITTYFKQNSGGYVGTDPTPEDEKDKFVYDKGAKWGGAGWHMIDYYSGVDSITQLRDPYWNATKIKASSDNFSFNVSAELDRWEYWFRVDYTYSANAYRYKATLVYQYETTAAAKPAGPPVADFTIPATGLVNTPVTVKEQSRADTGRYLVKWQWEMSKDGGSWTGLDWKTGTFTYAFGSEGKYDIRLKVTDDLGRESDWHTETINIGTPPPPPKPPVADFEIPEETYQGVATVGRDRSEDPDGQIVDRDFDNDDSSKSFSVRYDRDNNGEKDYGFPIFKFNNIGRYTITETVKDDSGLKAVSQPRTINVLPTPHAVIKVAGALKQNRRLILSANDSIASDDYPIDHTKDKWVITPVSGMSSSDIKLASVDKLGEQHILCRKSGKIKVSLTVTDSKGKTDTTEKEIDIAPDEQPTANFKADSTIFRAPDTGKATIKAVDASISPDSDIIASRTWELYFDSDNNGTCETFVGKVAGNEREVSFTVNSVGKYQLSLRVQEEFGQDTIEEFVTAADRLTGYKTMNITVENTPPRATFVPVPRVKADVMILTKSGDLDTLKSLVPGFEQNIRSCKDVSIDIQDVTAGFSINREWFRNTVNQQSLTPPIDQLVASGKKAVLYKLTDGTYQIREYQTNNVILSEAFDKVLILDEYAYAIKGNTCRKIDINTGQTIYTDTDQLYSSSTGIEKIYQNGSYIYLKFGSWLVAENASGTAVVSKRQFPNWYDTYIDPVTDDLYISYNSYGSSLVRINTATNSVYWSIDGSVGKVFGCSGGYVYAVYNKFSYDCRISKISTASGSVVWSWENTEYAKYISLNAGLFSNRIYVRYMYKDGNNYYHYYFRIFDLDGNLCYEKEFRNSGKLDSSSYLPDYYYYLSSDGNYLYEIEDDAYNGYKITLNLYNGGNSPVKTISINTYPAMSADTSFERHDGKDYYIACYGTLGTANMKVIDMTAFQEIFNYSYDQNARSSVEYFDVYGAPWYEKAISERHNGKGDTRATYILSVYNVLTGQLLFYNNEYASTDTGMKPARVIKKGNGYALVRSTNSEVTLKENDAYSDRNLVSWWTSSILSPDANWFYTEIGPPDLTQKSVASLYYVYDPGFFGLTDHFNDIQWRDNADKYVAVILNNSVSYTDKDIEDFVNAVNKVKAKVVFIGSSSNGELGTTLAKLTDGAFLSYNGTVSDGLSKLQDYIISCSVSGVKEKVPNIFLVGDVTSYTTYYSDYENDPENATKWIFNHQQSYQGRTFNNWMGTADLSGKELASPVETFDKPGFYLVDLKKQDRPTTDSRFSNYCYWSLTDQMPIIVHRKPVAQFTLSAVNSTDYIGTNIYKTGAKLRVNNQSYDPDFTDGIARTVFKWKRISDKGWMMTENPSTIQLQNEGVYVCHMMVQDNYGAWSDPYYVTVETQGAPAGNVPPYGYIDAPENAITNESVCIAVNYGDTDGYVKHVKLTAGTAILMDKNTWTDYAEESISYTFTNEGDYTLTMSLTDDDNALTNITRTVHVVKPVMPKVSIKLSGTQKENRRISFALDVVRGTYDIDWSKTKWAYKAISGGTAADMKVLDLSLTRKDMVVKKAGQYSTTATVYDVKGNSVDAQVIFTIAPDQPPVADFEVETPQYRDPENYNLAAFKITDRSASPDDVIASRKWYYIFDSDNEGDFSDEEKYLFDENTVTPSLEVGSVGKYQIIEEVKEDFTEPTIPQFVSDSDYKTATKVITVEVLNQKPGDDLKVFGLDQQDNPTENETLYGKPVTYYKTYEDPETDVMKNEEYSVKYSKVFDNVTGSSRFDGKTFETEINDFDLPGKYTVTYKVKDNPVNDDSFDSYRKYSDEIVKEILVYRPPVADFTVTADPSYKVNTNTYLEGVTFNLISQAYDPDHQYSRPDKGIVEESWEYKKAGEEWKPAVATLTLTQPGQYLIKHNVKDVENATDTKVMEIDITSDLVAGVNPSVTPANRDIVISARASVYASRVYADLLQAHVELKQTGADEQYSYWEGTYHIPSTQPDVEGDLINVTAQVMGTEIHKKLHLKVETPFTISATLSSRRSDFDLFGTGIPVTEMLDIKSITTQCAVNSDVDIDFVKEDKTFSSRIKTLYNVDIASSNGEQRIYKDQSYAIPANAPDGLYDIIFTAHLENSSVKTVLLPAFKALKVKTPINIRPEINGSTSDFELYIDDDNTIGAVTSKYTSQLTIELLGKTYAATVKSQSGDDRTWSVAVNVGDILEGDYPIKYTARTSNGNVETKTVTAHAVEPLRVIGGSDRSVYKAGQAMLLSAQTEGKAFKVEAKMWYPHNEYTSTNVTTLKPDSALTDPPQDVMTWHSRRTKAEGRDIIVIIPLKTPDGTYPVKFTAYKRKADGSVKTAEDTITIKVKGTIYDYSHSEIIGPLP